MKLSDINFLPAFMLKDFFFQAVLKAFEKECLGFIDEIAIARKERIPSQADKWLSRWEEFLGIPINEDKPVEYRRSVIVAKLRSSGTLTLERFKEIAMSFENGEVELTELAGKHQMKVKFVSQRGLPPNFSDFENMIKEVKPAHVRVVYEFTYNQRSYLKNYTRAQLKHIKKKDLRIANISEVLAEL